MKQYPILERASRCATAQALVIAGQVLAKRERDAEADQTWGCEGVDESGEENDVDCEMEEEELNEEDTVHCVCSICKKSTADKD